VRVARKVLSGSAVKSFAGGTPGVRELIASHTEHGRVLLHLPPDTRDFTGWAEQVGEVTRLIAADAASSETALGTERQVLALSWVWVLSGIVWSCARARAGPLCQVLRELPRGVVALCTGDSSGAAGATSGCSLPGRPRGSRR
jgi:hypothetical protein